MTYLSYDVLLSMIYFNVSAGGCSFRCFRGSKYVYERHNFNQFAYQWLYSFYLFYGYLAAAQSILFSTTDA